VSRRPPSATTSVRAFARGLIQAVAIRRPRRVRHRSPSRGSRLRPRWTATFARLHQRRPSARAAVASQP